ncbi:hypothetical protein IEQ34_007517 [Dendrobium chrysotoxum]|uniref:Uncharacterized protein n=1 Tax=Dendrobium chrysotoxum TaxID=161865 RepID=A0AAV7H5X8_DENCH|nr:hypothetical protein IEQ34_007517 [Dendrobium chrysotoxum]
MRREADGGRMASQPEAEWLCPVRCSARGVDRCRPPRRQEPERSTPEEAPSGRSGNIACADLARLPGLSRARCNGPRAPHSTRLETRTKEPDMRFECEHVCLDPKDGELCLSGAKPEETLVESRNDTDVQIVRLTQVGWLGCLDEPCHRIEGSMWAIFGKQNWKYGMNRKLGYGAQLFANPEPTKGVGRLRQQDGGHGSQIR